MTANLNLNLNQAVEEFDARTRYEFDRVTDLARLAEYAALRGWTEIAKTFFASATDH